MKDCIDRRQGSAEAFLCDDANRAYRNATDEAGWQEAARRAMAVVEYLNRDETRVKHGKGWADQIMDCLARAAQAAQTKGGGPCPASH